MHSLLTAGTHKRIYENSICPLFVLPVQCAPCKWVFALHAGQSAMQTRILHKRYTRLQSKSMRILSMARGVVCWLIFNCLCFFCRVSSEIKRTVLFSFLVQRVEFSFNLASGLDITFQKLFWCFYLIFTFLLCDVISFFYIPFMWCYLN